MRILYKNIKKDERKKYWFEISTIYVFFFFFIKISWEEKKKKWNIKFIHMTVGQWDINSLIQIPFFKSHDSNQDLSCSDNQNKYYILFWKKIARVSKEMIQNISFLKVQTNEFHTQRSKTRDDCIDMNHSKHECTVAVFFHEQVQKDMTTMHNFWSTRQQV